MLECCCSAFFPNLKHYSVELKGILFKLQSQVKLSCLLLEIKDTNNEPALLFYVIYDHYVVSIGGNCRLLAGIQSLLILVSIFEVTKPPPASAVIY